MTIDEDPDGSAYAAIAGAVEDARWAFGTGFADPLAGVDTALPEGVDPAALAGLCLALGDDALVLSHRLQQWVTRLPELEIEAAVANLALDLLGQARLLLARAGLADGSGRSDDDLAFFRPAAEWRAAAFAAAPIADFAELVLRLFVWGEWRSRLLAGLPAVGDPVLRAVAVQAGRETAYSMEWAGAWLDRLAGGTAESASRTAAAAEVLAPLLGSLAAPLPLVDAAAVANATLTAVGDRLASTSAVATPYAVGPVVPREAVTADAADVIDELQGLARQHPEARW